VEVEKNIPLVNEGLGLTVGERVELIGLLRVTIGTDLIHPQRDTLTGFILGEEVRRRWRGRRRRKNKETGRRRKRENCLVEGPRTITNPCSYPDIINIKLFRK